MGGNLILASGLVMAFAWTVRAMPVRIDVTPGDALDAVVERVRSLPVSIRSNGVEVVLSPGDYQMRKTLAFGPEDGGVSGKKPVVWRAAVPGAVRIFGSSNIPAAYFERLTDASRLQRLDSSVRDCVYVADLSRMDLGSIPSLPEYFVGAPMAPCVFVNGRFGTLARWPNRGWASFTQCVDKGRQVGEAVYPGSYRDGAFLFPEERAARWHFEEGVWLNGYWTHDWHQNSIKGRSWGVENGTNGVLRLCGSMPYGVMGETWGRADRRFYVFNSFDELDCPGEWWLDRESKKLYVVLTRDCRITDETVLISACSGSYLVSGNGVDHLLFEGIDFCFNYGRLVDFRRSHDVVFSRCRFYKTAADAIYFPWCERCQVVDCEAFDVGATCVNVHGGDRQTLRRSDNLVSGCNFHDYGLFTRTYSSAVEVGGVGVTVRGCKMSNAPHMAILYRGNEHLIESNEIHHVLLETGDAGAVYCGRDWTTQGNVLRYNFVHDLGRQGEKANTMGFYFDDCTCGHSVYGNVFWRVPRGIMIGGGRDIPVCDNVFADCQIGLSLDGRGRHWTEWEQLIRKAEKIGYTNEPWASRYPRLARILHESPREPRYDDLVGNVFLNCSEALMLVKGNGMQPIIDRLVISNNWVFAANGRLSAAPDRHTKVGFNVCTNLIDAGFVDVEKGDFRVRKGSFLDERLPKSRKLR